MDRQKYTIYFIATETATPTEIEITEIEKGIPKDTLSFRLYDIRLNLQINYQ